MAAELLFPAMGTHVQLMACGLGPTALHEARRTIADLEARWSRFQPTSEISRINAAAGRWTRVSPDTFRLVEAAVTAWRITGGRFDPTILKALVAAGYDRTFADISSRRGTSALGTLPAPGADHIELDEATSSVRVPAGSGIDLGGIAKGYAADLIVGQLTAAGAAGALANLGGDIRVAGEPPVPPCWRVGATNVVTGDDLPTIGISEGSVVTSTRMVRTWLTGDVEQHHLIDPSTGRPAETGLASVTIVGSRAIWAEVLAKAVFVAGPVAGAALAADFGATGLLIGASGSVTYLPGVGEFLL